MIQTFIQIQIEKAIKKKVVAKDAPIENIEAPEEGIASVNTGLPMYRQDGNNRFLQYSGSPYSSQPNDLLNNFFAATRERTENLNNPNKIQGLINSGMTKIGMDPQRSIVEMIRSGQVDLSLVFWHKCYLINIMICR